MGFSTCPICALHAAPVLLRPNCASGSTHCLRSLQPAQQKALEHSWRTQAVRKDQQTSAGEWASLATDPEDIADEEDPELVQSINQLCNGGLRLMLRGDVMRIPRYQDELSSYGQHFSSRGNIAGATFIYVLYKMTEHILPKEMVGLEGVYLEAFSKMHGLLEDSGWQLAKEPEEGQQLELQEEPTEEQLQATSYLN